MLSMEDLAKRVLYPTTPYFLYEISWFPGEDYFYRMAPPPQPNNQPFGVWLPQVTVQKNNEIQRSMEQWLPGVEWCIQEFKNRGITTGDEKLDAYLTDAQTILHEEGHWVHFVHEYNKLNLGGSKYNEDSANEKNALNLKSYKDVKDYEGMQRAYRESKIEKFADEYAFDKIKTLPLYDILAWTDREAVQTHDA